MSSTTAKCLEEQNLFYTKQTAKFVETFDRVFDCLNVTKLNEHITSRKPDLAPYRDVDDPRFEVLFHYNIFLFYFVYYFLVATYLYVATS